MSGRLDSSTHLDTYDYIVVGGGTAGCVLASRLSEDADASVLLIEAGSRTPLPAMAVVPAWPTLSGSSWDWCDETVTLAATGATMSWPRGRGLGGSSAINAMSFLRGHRSSYDAWAENGAPGWAFEDLLPMFMRSERTEGRDRNLRGTKGPLIIAPPADRHPIAAAGIEAATEIGCAGVSDIGDGLQEGFGWCDLNVVKGHRQSAADAYLNPILPRPNLDLVTNAIVDRLKIANDRCTGVVYRRSHTTERVNCSSEVVIACGTIGSPQLLMLSGIGPACHLDEVGISVKLDLPGVGENLHDHPMCGLIYRAAQPVPAGINNHGEAVGLLRSDPELPGPDLQVMFLDIPLRAQTLPGPAVGEGYTINVSLMRPHSRGSIKLRRSAVGAAPLIDPRYYADDRDCDAMIAGLRAARRIGEAEALAPWRDSQLHPGRSTNGDNELRDYLGRNLRSYHHYGGTCRIGEDDWAVVDTDLRVAGIDGLRVADASVMPSPVSANTAATVYAIAERAAELLRHADRSGLARQPMTRTQSTCDGD